MMRHDPIFHETPHQSLRDPLGSFPEPEQCESILSQFGFVRLGDVEFRS